MNEVFMVTQTLYLFILYHHKNNFSSIPHLHFSISVDYVKVCVRSVSSCSETDSNNGADNSPENNKHIYKTSIKGIIRDHLSMNIGI